MSSDDKEEAGTTRPNFLILCMDQWQTHMRVPEAVRFPAMERLEKAGVSFDRHYCTVPICTPSRATMWTGVHAKQTGLWDNTNFAWIDELSPDVPTIGQLLREHGYYTAFKGKWHLSEVPLSEDALEPYGFSDYQQWGEMFGAPLQGEQLDAAAAFEAADWLDHTAPSLNQPWLLVCSLINPHDIMFLQSSPIEEPHPNGAMAGLQTTVQRLGWFQEDWGVELPENHEDDLRLQPFGVHSYKETIDLNYGRVPDERDDLWKIRRNYLVNAMRLVDAEFAKVLDAMDRQGHWENTVILFVSDHGEMNGAHRMAQKGAIHFDEATVSNLTICAPGAPRGRRTGAVGSHLDLAPTLLQLAGLSESDIRARYPHLKGRSLWPAVLEPEEPGPRGSAAEPGDGALMCWDGLNMLDHEWALTGALKALTDMGSGPRAPKEARAGAIREVGKEFGAPDFSKRTFFRAVVDGRYKLVRWFSPLEYGNPSRLEELYALGDVTLHDLVEDPGELENLAHPDHPHHAPDLVERMLTKLHALIAREIGEDTAPFDLDMFGTRDITYNPKR